MNSSRAEFAASRGNSKPTVLTRLVWSGTPRFWTHENAKENWVPKYLPSSHPSSSANAHNVTKRVFLRFRLHLSFLSSISHPVIRSIGFDLFFLLIKTDSYSDFFLRSWYIHLIAKILSRRKWSCLRLG